MSHKVLNRRQLLRLAAAAPAAAALAACALPVIPLEDPGGASDSPAPPDTEGITITHWQPFSAGHRAAVEMLKERFEEQNGGVTIEMQPVFWNAYWDRVSAAEAAADPPDTYRIPMGLAENHISGGHILPVSELLLSNMDIEATYLPWTLQRAKVDDRYYGLPVDVQTLVVFRNNALYEEAGLDPAAPFADLEDLFSQAQALTVQDNGRNSQIGCNTGYASAWLTILFQQYLQREEDGATWIDPESDRLVWQDYPAIFEAFNWFCTLSAQTDDDEFLSFLSSEEQFVLDKSAMQIGHPAYRRVLERLVPEIDYTIVPFPGRQTGQEIYTAGSHWIWVVSQSAAEYAETVWSWVVFGTDEEAQTVWHEEGGDLPSLKTLTADSRFRPDGNAAVCIDSLSHATPWEWVGWIEWITEFNGARNRVVNDGADPRETFATLIDNLNGTIGQYTA